jgi:hypothetical protein
MPMSRNIAVMLSSSQHFRNTGMFSVEWAAYRFFKENFPGNRITFYVPHLSPESEYPDEYQIRVPYAIYRQIDDKSVDDIWAADLIVYWSDFFHTRHFIEQYLANYTNVDMEIFYSAYFLEGAPHSVLRKAIAFGNSLMFFSDFGKPHDRYSRAFYRLYKTMPIAMPRDMISYQNLVKFRSNHDCLGCCSQGVDPAMLLPNQKNNPGIAKNNLGLFIGRRTEIDPKHVKNIKRFAKKTGRQIHWIDWMRNTESLLLRAIKNPRQAPNLIRHMLLAARYRQIGHESNPLFNLNRYDMIVTDTYHLAVNAIRCKIPVFCIGTGEIIYGKDSLDLHDQKKEAMMKMFGLGSKYGVPTVSSLSFAEQDGPVGDACLDMVAKISRLLKYECERILNASI